MLYHSYNTRLIAGVSEPRASVTGRELPTARLVSTLTHKDLGFHDHAVTVYLPAWGQLIDHDMAMGAESKGRLATIELIDSTQQYKSISNAPRKPKQWKLPIENDSPKRPF